LEERQVVTPGTTLAASEEYAGGPGTFEESGSLYASVAGELEKDEHQRGLRVHPRVRVHPLQPGDTVIARVHDIYDQIAALIILRVENKPGERSAVGRDMVFIRIGEVQRAYTQNFRDAFKIGDVARARVSEVTPLGTYVTMKESDLGIVIAYCSNCRHALAGQGPVLRCTYCGRSEPRHTAGFEPEFHRRPYERPMGEPGRGMERRSFERGPRFTHRGPRRESGGRGGPRFRR
jgi:exosome complex RNA-binding protein Csl4